MKIISHSANETLNIGRKIAGELRKGDIVCLFGELGAGKTVLVKGIALRLGIKKNEVISPTFVLIRQYPKAKVPLYHFDLYRLNQLKDILSLGYEEYFYDEGITVIEWADRLRGFLPSQYLKVEITIKDKNRRVLKLQGFGKYYQDLVSKV
jgi:tRNA threonylcarbamoyladenosine biosynthesis protein TsaE